MAPKAAPKKNKKLDEEEDVGVINQIKGMRAVRAPSGPRAERSALVASSLPRASAPFLPAPARKSAPCTCQLSLVAAVRHILCEKQSKILEALKELQGWTDETTDPPTVHEPAKFNQTAVKYSEDAARDGGNLGWRTRQQLNGVFADAAFKMAKEPWSTVDKRKGKMTPQCVLRHVC